MDWEFWKGAAALWGAAIATWLAILKIRETRPVVHVVAPDDIKASALVRVFNPSKHPVVIHRARMVSGPKFQLMPHHEELKEAMLLALHVDDLNVIMRPNSYADFDLRLDKVRAVLMFLTWSSGAGWSLPAFPLVIWRRETTLKRLRRVVQGSSKANTDRI